MSALPVDGEVGGTRSRAGLHDLVTGAALWGGEVEAREQA